MLKKLLLQIHVLLLFFLLNPLIRAGENDIKIIEIEKPITLIKGALRQILIQKNNIKNYDNIDVKLNESLNISIEEKTKKLCRIVYSKVKENDIMEVFIDDDCDGFLDLKIVYKNNIKIEEYHITHSFKKVEKSKGVSPWIVNLLGKSQKEARQAAEKRAKVKSEAMDDYLDKNKGTTGQKPTKKPSTAGKILKGAKGFGKGALKFGAKKNPIGLILGAGVGAYGGYQAGNGFWDTTGKVLGHGIWGAVGW